MLLPAVLAVLALGAPVPAAAGTPAGTWSWREVSVRRIGTACVPGSRPCVREIVTTTVVFDVIARYEPGV
ncbi:hypothetical protein OHS18_48480 [Amycolatopsis sp. NBC_00355]|uniref:hypothetical protein n=1 Tax=Amycolatopsis sp. NBC_00355 TaxID=2975957 RepID=UPI002E26242A